MEKEVPPSHKLQEHLHEQQNLFELQESNLFERNHDTLIQGKIHIQKKLKQRPRILVKLTFREMWYSNYLVYVLSIIWAFH